MKNNNSEKPLVISYLRWSTGQQRLGDSERRQLAEAQEWLDEHGYTVDERYTLKDDGKSGYYSENFSEDGALGKFINEVKSGKIPKGTILIIEDFSRFSRAQVSIAQQRFLELINNGIRIYVAKDKKEYSKENHDLTDMIISLAKMAAANEESARKSYHLTKFWDNARKKAVESTSNEYPVLLPAHAPYWLKKETINGQKVFVKVPDRVETVKLIFQLADSGGYDGLGLGSTTIVRYLEEKGIKPFKGEKENTATSFNDSYVLRLLNDQRLLGYLQPHITPIDSKTGKRKRIKQGDPIPNYFPQIIDKDLFDRVNMKRKQRKSYTGGKVAKKFSNLFTKVIKCSYCGHSMTLFTKRGSVKEGGISAYLQCSEGTKHLKCGNRAVRYHDTFETSIISSLKELDLSFLFSNKSNTDINEVNNLNNEKYKIEKDLLNIEQELKNCTKLLIRFPDDEEILNEKHSIKHSKKIRINKINEINNKLVSMRRSSSHEEFKDNLSIVSNSKNQDDTIENYLVRKSINTTLIDIIQFISIDGVNKTAWIVLNPNFWKNLIKAGIERGNEYYKHKPIDHKTVRSKEMFLPSNDVIRSFGTGFDMLHIKIKLKRFQDREPTYEDILSMREGFEIAPCELIKINDICNNAINKSWNQNTPRKYEVLDWERYENLTSDIFNENQPSLTDTLLIESEEDDLDF